MLANRRAQRENESGAQLLKLYSNRAGVKRELNELRKERHELLDKLKDQEGAILRAQEQLNDKPLRINVLLDEYWDIFAVLC